MKQSDPILVATDLLAPADRAIDRAVSLAQQLDRPLVVVHVVENDGGQAGDGADLKERIAEVMPANAGDYRCLFPVGNATECIARAAEDENAFCLVTGAARYNSLRDYFLGTAIDYTLRHTDQTVLVVKKRAKAPYTDIVFGTDFSPAARRALEHGVRMFPAARFHVVHAFSVPYEGWQKAEYIQEELRKTAQSELDRFVAEVDIPADVRERLTARLLKGGAHQAIADEVKACDAHLVIIGSHGHGGVRQALVGSNTSDLLHIVPVDTLVVNVAREGGD